MSINKGIFTVLAFVFLFFLAPMPAVMAQSADGEIVENEFVEQTVVKEKKSDKKKDKEKDKDVVEINSAFFLGLIIDITTVLLIIFLIYYRNYRKMDYIFTFIIFNIVIFLLTFVLNKVKISMGAAFGLFAVFSMLRYRTSGIGLKDMTYLFIFIAIGLISAIQLEVTELLTICGVIFLSTLLLDGNLFFRRTFTKDVEYENIELIKPQNYQLLLQDLRNRTGLNIQRLSILKINFLRDTALIRIYYYE